MQKPKPVEWPTVGLAFVIYSGWVLILFYHASLPASVVGFVGAWLIAWHGSLQHELLHGHPTRWSAVNTALGFAPLSLWLPYQTYRNSHLAHHRAGPLTSPFDDPESYYWTEAAWSKLRPIGRFLVKAQMTLVGRLVLGPAWNAGRLLAHELAAARTNPRDTIMIWSMHLAGCAAVLIFVAGVCKMSLWFYVFGIVYPGTSLSLVRSFVEHRASETAEEQTAIVENTKVLGALFLFNNLHVVHHLQPELPWYRIPKWYRDRRDSLIEPKAARVYNGYFEIARRFLFAPFDDPVHPLTR